MVRADGHWDILIADFGVSQTEAFFLAALTDRGLHGIHMVLSDFHKDPEIAFQVALQVSVRQRFPVHFLRSALETLPPGRLEDECNPDQGDFQPA